MNPAALVSPYCSSNMDSRMWTPLRMRVSGADVAVGTDGTRAAFVDIAAYSREFAAWPDMTDVLQGRCWDYRLPTHQTSLGELLEWMPADAAEPCVVGGSLLGVPLNLRAFGDLARFFDGPPGQPVDVTAIDLDPRTRAIQLAMPRRRLVVREFPANTIFPDRPQYRGNLRRIQAPRPAPAPRAAARLTTS
jgi:hypothetical protein